MATKLPDLRRGADELVDRVLTADIKRLPQMLLQLREAGELARWGEALVIYRVDREKLYEKEGFELETGTFALSTAEWAGEALKISKAQVSNLKKAASWVCQDFDAKKRWLSVSPHGLLSVLEMAQSDPDGAYELVTTSTREEIREKMRDVKEGRHYDVSKVSIWKLPMSQDTLDEIEPYLHLARHMTGDAFPKDDQVIRLVIMDWATGWDASESRGVSVFSSDPPELRTVKLKSIMAGDGRCIECNVWNPIQWHHAVERSALPSRDPDDPDWPAVWLCPKCHKQVHEDWQANWKEWLRRWIARFPALGESVDRFLGDLRLEEL